MAPIDNGEEKIERVSSEIARSGAQVTVRFVTGRLEALTKAIASQGLRLGSSSLRWTMAAVQKPGGQVSMKELSELPSRTGREVVSLDDKDVMQALEKNLKGRGVHYAIEREKIDGKIQHILHVRGDDAQVVADSLERAAEAVDAKRELKQERSVDQDAPKKDQPDKPETAPSRESTPAEDDSTRLVEHGAAPYQHEAGKRDSYFVTVERANGTQETLWGVDLERAITESGAKAGDVIDVKNIGSTPVTLPNGIETHRNTWNVEVTESAREPKQEHAIDPNEVKPERAAGPGQASEPQQEKSALTVDDPNQIQKPTIKEAREWHAQKFPDDHKQWQLRRSYADTASGRASDDRELISALHRTQQTEAILEKGKLNLSPEEAGALADELRVHASTLDANNATPYTSLAEHVSAKHEIPATRQDMAAAASALGGAYDREVQRTGDPFSLGRGELSDVRNHSQAVVRTIDRQQEIKAPTPDQGRSQPQPAPKVPEERKPGREPAPAAGRTKAEKRANGDTSQKPKEVRQREIREKVKARAEKIKADAPKPAPKLDAPTPGLKR